MLFATMVRKQVKSLAELYDKCPETEDEQGNRTCGCPEREEVPNLTMQDLENLWENEVSHLPRQEVKHWITEKFEASSLNNCRMQIKPVETGSPPIELRVRPTYKPFVCKKAGSIPLPMQDAVFKQLMRDEHGSAEAGPQHRTPLPPVQQGEAKHF